MYNILFEVPAIGLIQTLPSNSAYYFNYSNSSPYKVVLHK